MLETITNVFTMDNIIDLGQIIIADIVLLQSLGIRLVLVHGAAPQIEAALVHQGKSS